MHETDGIYLARLLWSDEQAVEALFALLPTHIVADIRESHERHPDQFIGMRHDEQTRQAFFVDGDARYIEVWTFKPVALLEEAAVMSDAFEDFGIDEEIAIRTFHAVTGHEVSVVQLIRLD